MRFEALEAEALDHSCGLGVGLSARHAVDLSREDRVVENRSPGHQHVALGHEGNAPQKMVNGLALAVDIELAVIWRQEPNQDVEQRALAAATGPDDGYE